MNKEYGLRLILIFISLICVNRYVFGATDYQEITETVLELGVSLEDFESLWPNYCKPGWNNEYEGDLTKTSDLVKNTIGLGFLNAEYVNGKTILKSGPACAAVMNYYFNEEFDMLISKFINSDRIIIEKYGYSSIDLFLYPKGVFVSYSTYNWNDQDIQFLEQTIQRFEENEIFSIKKRMKNTGLKRVNGELTEITVPPYATYNLETTDKFKNAHKMLLSNQS